MEKVEFVGEYAIARLKYLDPDLPVALELSALTPFAPLDSRFSSLPAAFLTFRIHNPTPSAQEVALAGLMLNPVGYDSVGTIHDGRHPNFGGNVKEVFSESGAAGLLFRAEAGPDPAIDRPLRIVAPPTLKGLAEPPRDWPQTLRLDVLEQPPRSEALRQDASRTLLWLEEAPADLPAAWLQAARALVEAGGKLVIWAGSSHCGVSARVVVAPGATAEIPFVLAWVYPNK